jgi:sugar/nucleoside kinase (ribokinase family)
MTKAFDVIGLGENSVDMVCRVPTFPQSEGFRSKQPLLERRVSCGGRVATTMAGCARLGLRARYIGTVGSDTAGTRLRAALAGCGVNIDRLEVREAATRQAIVLVADDTGERAVLWERDERLALAPAKVLVEATTEARLLHVDDEDPAASLEAAQTARRAGLMVTSDFDRLTDETNDLLRLATHPILAEGLLVALTGTSDPERGLRRLQQELQVPLLTVTLGSRGAAALERGRVLFVAAQGVRAVDTTAAGDLFRSGFIFGLLQDWPLGQVLGFANATAAAGCTRHGAIDAAPTLEEVMRLLG